MLQNSNSNNAVEIRKRNLEKGIYFESVSNFGNKDSLSKQIIISYIKNK